MIFLETVEFLCHFTKPLIVLFHYEFDNMVPRMADFVSLTDVEFQ